MLGIINKLCSCMNLVCIGTKFKGYVWDDYTGEMTLVDKEADLIVGNHYRMNDVDYLFEDNGYSPRLPFPNGILMPIEEWRNNQIDWLLT